MNKVTTILYKNILIGIVLLACIGCGNQRPGKTELSVVNPTKTDDALIKNLFFSVGNGLSSLTRFSKHNYMMYDCGMGKAFLKNGNYQTSYMKKHVDEAIKEYGGTSAASKNSKEITLVILSHPHVDHYNTFNDLFGTTKDKNVYIPQLIVCGGTEADWKKTPIYSSLVRMNKTKETTVQYTNNIDPSKNTKAPPRDLRAGMGNIWNARILAAGKPGSNLNGRSVILMLDAGDYEVIFTGDAMITYQTDMFKNNALKNLVHYPIEVFQVSHHGSDNNTSKNVLKAVQPARAIISCDVVPGDQDYNDNYRLPKYSVFKLLKKHVSGKANSNDRYEQWYFESNGDKIMEDNVKEAIWTTQMFDIEFAVGED